MEKENNFLDLQDYILDDRGIPLQEASYQESEYDRVMEKQEKDAVTFMRFWSKEKKLEYFKQLFQDYDLKDIYDWIDEIGLDEAFRKTYALFGNDSD